eukprot:TRINITY_DN3837_c0_g1_i1.p1 TRINITY_DN3837_c0_g1~~TRINITY_DN3837_c0_g1_i1.p1  ORF type:complete len:382 (+),score=74.93 TRINITY_DN3837_c0_g1_i1:247-1392(+)
MKCQFFIKKKGRNCTQPVDDLTQIYCPYHRLSQNENLVSCPYNPKHLMSEKKLKRHVYECPDKDQVDPEYYSLDVNVIKGDDVGEVLSLSQMISVEELHAFIKRVEVFHAMLEEEGYIDYAYEEIVPFEFELPEQGWGDRYLKMSKQMENLVGVLRDCCGVNNEYIYLEFGAGSGRLSQNINKYFHTDHILIDFGHFKNKAKPVDRTREWEMIRIDIKDLVVDRLPVVKDHPQKELVAYSKHLCGVATDLTLQCIKNDIASRGNKWNTIMIALCCHHKCKWNQYENKSFFTNQGFEPNDFTILQKLTSWATYYQDKSTSNTELDWTEIPITEKETIGRKCKDLIDIGRLTQWKSHGYKATLKKYVSPSISPENSVLIIVAE